MTTLNHRYYITPMLLLVAGTLFCGACSKKSDTVAPAAAAAAQEKPARRDPGEQVAIIPEADMLFYVDTASMRQAPIIQAITEKRAESGKTAPGKMNESDWTEVKKLSGLDEDDLTSLLISANLDALETSQARLSDTIKQFKGACAIGLAKPLSYDTLRTCMRVMSSRSAKAQLEELTLAGQSALRVLPSSKREPVIYTAVSATERTLFIAFDEDVMTGMLDRDKTGQTATPSPELIKLRSALDGNPQWRLLFRATDAMRAAIGKRIDALAAPTPQKQPTQRSIIAGFISPLRNTQHIVLAAKADEALDIRLSIELSSPAEAQQCAGLVQTFIIPMLIKRFDVIDPNNTLKVDDSLEATCEDNTLTFEAHVTEEDVKNWDPSTFKQ